MNGIHDMGGMTVFGPIKHEINEPVFHHDWERRVFAVNMALIGAFGPVDRIRHAIERMNPIHYLETSYYEHWLAAIELLAKEFAVLSDEEITTGIVKSNLSPSQPPPDGETIESIIKAGIPATRDTGRQVPRFNVGEKVRARNLNSHGHTRLPRYVRGRAGIIDRIYGTHAFPDTAAHDQGESPQPLYNVCFTAKELWGPVQPRQDNLHIDLWEDYLEPLEEKR